MKKQFGNTGFEVFPVAYGGIVSMQDGQELSDRYVAWAVEKGVNYFDVAPSYLTTKSGEEIRKAML